jgi:hypothetical protein
MIAYPDGTEARVGDVVALAHGVHGGTVRLIIESVADMGTWNWGEPGLLIETSYAGLVMFPNSRSKLMKLNL